MKSASFMKIQSLFSKIKRLIILLIKLEYKSYPSHIIKTVEVLFSVAEYCYKKSCTHLCLIYGCSAVHREELLVQSREFKVRRGALELGQSLHVQHVQLSATTLPIIKTHILK
jgi:hypothetical protein